MKATVLGCGSSMGTPAAGNFWGKCDPNDLRNYRTRASLLVQSDTTNLVIDASYDLRIHLNRVQLKKVDGVLISHAHSDHVNGIDDFRAIAINSGKRVEIYSDQQTLDEMERRWPYLFSEDPEGIYIQAFNRNKIESFGRHSIGDISFETFEQDHHTISSLGFRFGDFAYSVDVAMLSDRALQSLKGVETWIVDACSYHKDIVLTHANIRRVMEWVDVLKPKMTYLTVLTTHMDYKTLCNELPQHIRPAYDGLELDIASTCVAPGEVRDSGAVPPLRQLCGRN
jgi:phosphoribosyl 1,2-cyclic phosphate phosphodiesterase